MNRRHFLTTLSSATAFSAFPAMGMQPFHQAGEARLRVGLAAYSFRKYFRHQRGGKEAEVPEDQRIDMKDFITFCAQQGVDGAEVTSYFFPQDLSRKAAIDVARHAFLHGVDLSGTAIGNNFTHPAGETRDEQLAYTKFWIDRASDMGAPHVRVFAGKHAKGVSEEEANENVIETLRMAADYAAKKGVFLGIENHDSVGDHETLLNLVKGVDHPWVGVNLDSGNFRTDDPYVDMVKSAPWSLNVQLKVEMRVGGAPEKVETDLPRVIGILKDSGYKGYVILEYEAAEDPWEAVPPLLEELKVLCA